MIGANWKQDGKGASITRTGFVKQFTGVFLYDLLCDRKTESGAVFFGSGKDIKEIGGGCLRNAAAKISDIYLNEIVLTENVQKDRAGFAHSFVGIF